MGSPDDRDFFDEELLTEGEQLELIAMEHNGPQVGDYVNASGSLVQINAVERGTAFFVDEYGQKRRFAVERMAIERACGWGDVKFCWELQAEIVQKRVDAMLNLMRERGPAVHECVVRESDQKPFIVDNVSGGFVYTCAADEEPLTVRTVDIVPERGEAGFYYWRQV